MTALTGFLVPAPPWEARLVGSFGKALSLLHPDGALVSVVRRPEYMEARALAPSSAWDGFASRASGPLCGDAGPVVARWDGRCLTLAGIARLDFCGADLWDPRPALADAAAAVTRLRSDAPSWERLRAAFSRAARVAVAASRARGKRAEGLHAEGPFREAFRALSLEAGFPANLVGFGPGTTPAGDDWLAGYLCGSDLVSGGPGLGSPRLRDAVSGALERTGAAGRSLLLGALAGGPPAYLAGLALAFAGGGLAEALERALGHGASSGEDALAGFTAALFQ